MEKHGYLSHLYHSISTKAIIIDMYAVNGETCSFEALTIISTKVTRIDMYLCMKKTRSNHDGFTIHCHFYAKLSG